MKDESELQQHIMMEAPKLGAILLRNNSGAMKDATGRVVRYGLGNESSVRSRIIKSLDLIGLTSIIITPEMVGKKVAVFTSVEVKHPDWNPAKKLTPHEKAQQAFVDWVVASGGFAKMVSSLDQFRSMFKL